MDGASWILGSIIAKEIKINGKKGMERAVLRSDDSVALNIAKYGGQFAHAVVARGPQLTRA